MGEFERVLVVPVFEHAFGKRLCAFEHRLRMCEFAFAAIRNVEVSPVEAGLERPSYTLRTLERLSQEHPDWRLRLLIGSDVLTDTSKWYGFEEIAALAPPFVVPRAGFPGTSWPELLPDISSTRVRSLLALRGEASAAAELSRVVPRAVLAYIEANDLYRMELDPEKS
jgi:nicotinate-nucleotide adenylyltransferase